MQSCFCLRKPARRGRTDARAHRCRSQPAATIGPRPRAGLAPRAGRLLRPARAGRRATGHVAMVVDCVDPIRGLLPVRAVRIACDDAQIAVSDPKRFRSADNEFAPSAGANTFVTTLSLAAGLCCLVVPHHDSPRPRFAARRSADGNRNWQWSERTQRLRLMSRPLGANAS